MDRLCGGASGRSGAWAVTAAAAHGTPGAGTRGVTVFSRSEFCFDPGTSNPPAPLEFRAMPSLPDRTPSRVIIEGVSPEVDGGRFPAKRTVGETVVVEADIHTDGHDVLAAALRHRKVGSGDWSEAAIDRDLREVHVHPVAESPINA